MAQMNAEDDAYRKTYGVEKGSPGYVACRNQLTQIRANNAAAGQASQQAAGRAMTATGAAMIQNASKMPGTTCMPNGIGGFRCN